jgi:ATP synthase protein I
MLRVDAAPQKIVRKLIILQVMVTLIIAAVMWITMDGQAAYSAIIAGLICTVSNAYFGWKVFKYKGARAAKKFVVAFCIGELAKLFIQAALFVLAVLFLNIAIIPFLISYVINLMVLWLAPFINFKELN